MRNAFLVLAFSALALFPAQAAEKWRMQYFYDQDDSTLSITDMQFPTASRGFAVGGIIEHRGKPKPVRLMTSDGGEHWTLEPVRDNLYSLFFLDEKLGWMVSERRIWHTADGGTTWTQNSAPKGVLRVRFLTPEHGWAVGLQKSVYETTDGGRNWKKLEAAGEPKSRAEYTTYNWIDFLNARSGFITGYSRPPRPAQQTYPSYMDPENPPRELPGMVIMLQTSDGGATWKKSDTSMFGIIARTRMFGDGRTLALLDYVNSFRYPSEVMYMDTTGHGRSVYRSRTHSVTDMALLPDGSVLLAGVETPSVAVRGALPGKVKILRSKDLANWEETAVDYRAVAGRVVLAASGKDIWAATDSGMILKLESK